MTTKEFSDQFDVLYNNITSNQAPGLNEYEKSVFLTKAQDEIVKNYFSPKGNPKQDGFDDSPKRQADFANIISKSTLEELSGISKFYHGSIAYKIPSDLFICLNEQIMDGNTPITIVPISYGEYDRLMSKPYKYPPKYQAWRLITQNSIANSEPSTVEMQLGLYGLRLVSSYFKPVRMLIKTANEAAAPAISETSTLVTITCNVSINQTGLEYRNNYLADNPLITPYLGDFSGLEGHSAFPAFPANPSAEVGIVVADLTNPGGNSGEDVNVAEVIGRFNTTNPSYNMRYIRRPKPIILVNLNDIDNSLTIHGERQAMTSELSEELHEEIIQRAVELAKVAWDGNVQTVVQAGQRSE